MDFNTDPNRDQEGASVLALKTNGGERLRQQLRFLIEIDKIKQIFRKCRLVDGTRYENDAEHSWHLALLAMTLSEHANAPVDPLQLLRMILIHDIVEIDAGDTFVYDTAGEATKRAREEKAADRIFGLLPDEQRLEFRALWEEFEAQETPTARFAGSIDRLAAILPNFLNRGGSWAEHGISKERVLKRNEIIAQGSETLWEFVVALVEEAETQGYFG